MSMNELYFTVLGPSGAGKTTLLACMNKTLSEVLSGVFFQNDSGGVNFLEDAYRTLETEANSEKLEFGTAITGTEEIRKYHFTISSKSKRENIHVHFYDFPGGWLNSNEASNYQQVLEITKKSGVIMAIINMPYVREYNGKYIAKAKIDEIQKIIALSLQENNDRDKLILLVPMKCEAYIKDTESIYADIERLFNDTIERVSGNKKAAIGIVPVQTIGNAKFSMFNIEGEEITGEFFRKPVNSKFSPENTDQPLRLALSFFMNHFDLPQDMNDILTKIQKDIKHEKFRVLSGEGLINGEGITRRIPLRREAVEPEVTPQDDPEPPIIKEDGVYKIAIMGASGTGKTIFLGSYFHLASEGQAKYTIAPISQESVDRMKELHQTLFVRKEPVIGTSERVNLSFSISEPEMEIELYDLRGGDTDDMSSWDAEKITSDLKNADGALFFISGEDLVKNPDRVWSSNMVFSAAISRLREGKLADIPIYFIITKGDTIPDTSIEDLKKRIASLIKRASTSTHGGGFFERNFFRKGQRVKAYKTEAMGKWPSVNMLPKDYEPKNVIEPMDELIIEMYNARKAPGRTKLKLFAAGILIAMITAESGLYAWDHHSWNRAQKEIERALIEADYPTVQRILSDFRSPSLVLPFLRADRKINEGYAKYEAALYPLVQTDILAVNENTLPSMTPDLEEAIKRVKVYLDVKNFAVIDPAHYEHVKSKKWYFDLVELFNYDVSKAVSSPDELMKIILQYLDQDTPESWKSRVENKIENLVRSWCKVLPVNVEPAIIESYISAADSLIENPKIPERVKRNLEAQKNAWRTAANDRWQNLAEEWIREAGSNREKAVKTLEQKLTNSPSPVVTERIRKVLEGYYLELVNQWLSEYRQDTDVPRLKALMNNYPGMTEEARKKLSDGIEERDKIRLDKAASLLARSRSLEELAKESAKLGADTNTETIRRVINTTTQSLMREQLTQIREVIAGYIKDGISSHYTRFSDGRKKLTESCNLLRSSIRPLTASDTEKNEEILSDIRKFEESLMNEIQTAHYNSCRQEFNRRKNSSNTGDISDCIRILNDFIRTWPNSDDTNTVKKVLDFLTTIQNGVQGRIVIVKGYFSKENRWNDTPDVYAVVALNSQQIFNTPTVGNNATPVFNTPVPYTWKVNNQPVTFAAYDAESVGDDREILKQRVSVSGFFGYRNLTDALRSGNGCTLDIRFEANIPSCPWERL